jgi:hypothetical protein
MKEAIAAVSGARHAYAAPQLKVYGAMQKLTASGMSGNPESQSIFGCKVAPNINFCKVRRP